VDVEEPHKTPKKRIGLGLMMSSGAHAAVLGYALVGFSSAKPFDAQSTPALPIELITPSEYDQITKGEKSSTKVDKPRVEAKKIAEVDPEPKPPAPEAKQNVEAPPPPPAPKPAEPEPPKPEPKKAEAPPPPPPPEPKPDLPKPEPKMAEAPKPDPKPEPKKVETPKPKPPEKKVDTKAQASLDDLVKKELEKTPQPKKAAAKTPDEKPRPAFDPTKIAALVDRRDPGRTTPQGRELAEDTTAGISNGTAQQLSLSEKSMINQMVIDQVRACWAPPIGASGASDLAVIVQFQLRQDGSLAGGPDVMNRSGNPAFQAAADAATRAVRRCSPLNLPQQYFDHWRSVQINFDPREMMGG
jgi:colicin import membrane protein